MCEFILTVMNVFSVYTGLSHFLVGLTLMVWGSDNLELLNMAISVKNKEEQIALSAILCCQVLCLVLIIPAACLIRMVKRDEYEISVMQKSHDRDQVVLPPLLASLLTLVVFLGCGSRVNRPASLVLLTIYLTYLSLSVHLFWSETE